MISGGNSLASIDQEHKSRLSRRGGAVAKADFNDLLWFLVVANERSFTKAAPEDWNCAVDAQPHD
jgi:hypothetical protein